jgi:phosphoribosylanthranilate isomerase
VNRTRVKFCGLARAGDVRLACELGVDALGFVLAPRSPRRIDPGDLPGLRAAVSPLVDVVALFMDPAAGEVLDAMRRLRPTLLQFHGSEEDSFCRSFGLPFMKSLPMAGGTEEALAISRRYPSAQAFVLDAHGPGEAGGTGRRFDWSAAPRPARPVFLAGGLAPGNVADAIRSLRPYAVDVSSGIESAPGLKDGERMRAFLDEVRRVDSEQYE